MISDKLSNTADWLAGHANRNVALAPHALADLAMHLLALAEQVRQLEEQPFTVTSGQNTTS